MSASNAFETAWLKLLLQNVNIANVGDATGLRGSSAAGNAYLSLHTADPGEAGDQTTNETAYTNYVRLAMPRDTSTWDVTGNTATNLIAAAFAACGATGATITHVAIGTSSAGAGMIIASMALSASRAISAGITPEFAIGELDLTAD